MILPSLIMRFFLYNINDNDDMFFESITNDVIFTYMLEIKYIAGQDWYLGGPGFKLQISISPLAQNFYLKKRSKICYPQGLTQLSNDKIIRPDYH